MENVVMIGVPWLTLLGLGLALILPAAALGHNQDKSIPRRPNVHVSSEAGVMLLSEGSDLNFQQMFHYDFQHSRDAVVFFDWTKHRGWGVVDPINHKSEYKEYISRSCGRENFVREVVAGFDKHNKDKYMEFYVYKNLIGNICAIENRFSYVGT